MLAVVTSGQAHAQAALDDTSTTPASGEPVGVAAEEKEKDAVEYGVGIRLRNVRVPQFEMELFLERAPGGSSNVGFGVDLTRRRGSVELQLGFEYENITPAEGVWIASGDNVATGDEADYLLSPDSSGKTLGWFTIEFTFLNHAPITKQLAFRYGGGAGLGIITGELRRYNIICAPGATNSSPEPDCVPPRFGGRGSYSEGTETQVKYNLPPVFPVVNAIIGLQYKPAEKVTINLEGGIRTLFFFGLSGSYFF
ncbi:MAG: hypothetical protein H0T89_23230 [Deltaproteobacteria bacterium]|nr:hypothetical protein [Deltaproteobacteria bacterium]MDQ3296619.1 hypothetical protein [Myxococcota bacterium]